MITARTTASLNVREAPDQAARRITALVIGERVVVHAGANALGKAEYVRITYRGTLTGFAYAAYLEPIPAERTPAEVFGAGDIKLKVRQGASIATAQIDALPDGTRVMIIGQAALLGQPRYVEIEYNGKLGWVYAGYLKAVPADEQTTQVIYRRPTPRPLFGLHGPADPWNGALNDGARRVLEAGRFESFKLCTAPAGLGDADGRAVDWLKARGIRTEFILARVIYKFERPDQRRPAGDDQDAWLRQTAQRFVSESLPPMRKLYEAGIRLFEVHNEPNIHTNGAPEGMWYTWKDGREFSVFFKEALKGLRQALPQARLGFPGVSPGPDVPNIRYAEARFMAEAAPAVEAADWLGLHAYWPNPDTPQTAFRRIVELCRAYPHKPIYITECSNPINLSTASREVKARQYKEWKALMNTAPENLCGYYFFLLSASAGFEAEVITPEMAAAMA